MKKMWKNAAKNLNDSYLYGKKNISIVESYKKEIYKNKNRHVEICQCSKQVNIYLVLSHSLRKIRVSHSAFRLHAGKSIVISFLAQQ